MQFYWVEVGLRIEFFMWYFYIRIIHKDKTPAYGVAWIPISYAGSCIAPCEVAGAQSC